MMFSPFPTSSHSQDHASTTQIINCCRLTSQQSRMAKGDRSYHRAKMNVLRMISQVNQRNNHFQGVFIGRDWPCEMIRTKQTSKAKRLNHCSKTLPTVPR